MRRASPPSRALAILHVAAVLALNVAASAMWRMSWASDMVRDVFGSSATLAVNVITGSAIVALAWIFSLRDPDRRATFGLAIVPWGRMVKWTALVVVGSKLVAIPVTLVSRLFGGHDSDAMRRAIEHVANGPLLVVISLALWAGIWEEIVFRGFVLSRLRVVCDRWFSTRRAAAAAIVAQAAVFALVHLWQSPEGQINTALVGAVLGYAAIRCRSIVPGIIGHAVFDLIGLAAARFGVHARG